jgi:uncharacterized membrane protein
MKLHDKPKPQWQPGDGWCVIALACLPLVLVLLGIVVVKLWS